METIITPLTHAYLSFHLNNDLSNVEMQIKRHELFPFASNVQENEEETFTIIENISSQDSIIRLTKIKNLILHSMNDLKIERVTTSQEILNLEAAIKELSQDL